MIHTCKIFHLKQPKPNKTHTKPSSLKKKKYHKYNNQPNNKANNPTNQKNPLMVFSHYETIVTFEASGKEN